jgi:hypothetical protein
VNHFHLRAEETTIVHHPQTERQPFERRSETIAGTNAYSSTGTSPSAVSDIAIDGNGDVASAVAGTFAIAGAVVPPFCGEGGGAAAASSMQMSVFAGKSIKDFDGKLVQLNQGGEEGRALGFTKFRPALLETPNCYKQIKLTGGEFDPDRFTLIFFTGSVQAALHLVEYDSSLIVGDCYQIPFLRIGTAHA